MNTMKTSTGNTTALFIKDGILSQHPGWYLQKIRKNIIFPRIAHLPTKYATFSPLPSGYLEVKNISMIPRIENDVFTHEGDQFPSEHKVLKFDIKTEKDDFQYFLLFSEKKEVFASNFEILLEDCFEDPYSHFGYSYITYARIPSPVRIPIILDSIGKICVSPF